MGVLLFRAKRSQRAWHSSPPTTPLSVQYPPRHLLPAVDIPQLRHSLFMEALSHATPTSWTEKVYETGGPYAIEALPAG